MNMIFAETLIASYGLPVDFTAAYYRGWKMGKDLCLATGFILTTAGSYLGLKTGKDNCSDMIYV